MVSLFSFEKIEDDNFNTWKERIQIRVEHPYCVTYDLHPFARDSKGEKKVSNLEILIGPKI